VRQRAAFLNKSPSLKPDLQKQRGVAVIMALLLTTLAITIVASLFWQQQVQVRLIENQRLQLQKQWILLGALDWASLILREDAKYSSTDTLDEPWSVPLAETRLDQYVENGKADSDIADTTLSGGISDAQARFNLTNLCPNGTIDLAAVAAFARLLTLLHINPELAQTTASMMAMVAPLATPIPLAAAIPPASAIPQTTTQLATSSVVSIAPPVAPGDGPQPLAYIQVEDLLAIPGFSPALVEQLKPYVIFLPRSTTLNINTASAEVIAAVIGLPLSNANTLLATRKAASFIDLADVSNRLVNTPFNAAGISVSSNYFLVNGKVHMNRARLDMQALLERNGITTQLIWIREY
jgi:general secretion pathway protein K